jgi:hypothetical protein
MSHVSQWSFSNRVSEDRITYLTAVKSFREVVLLIADANVAGYHIGVGWSHEIQGCKRPEFLIEVSNEIFDIFFNSPVGYRAQYAKAPKVGISQNAYLIESLTDRLTAYAKTNTNPNMTLPEVRACLKFPSAKIWIKEEDENALHEDDLVVEIDFPRWVEKAKAAYYSADDDEQRNKAIRGVLAPTGKFLEVKGGWLDSSGQERINPFKAARAADIWQYGFS